MINNIRRNNSITVFIKNIFLYAPTHKVVISLMRTGGVYGSADIMEWAHLTVHEMKLYRRVPTIYPHSIRRMIKSETY